jgi:hypothetical protein
MEFGIGIRSLVGALVTAIILSMGQGVSAESVFKPISPAKIDQTAKKNAERVAIDLLTKWRENKFEPLSDAFSPRMKRALTPDAQEDACAGLKALFGTFRSLSFAEAVASKNLPDLVVYRFRGDFSGAKKKPEIRVVIDNKGKVSGFWIKHWRKEIR